MTTINIGLVGDNKVGKTALLQRFITGEYLKQYTPTKETNIFNIEFKTNVGLFILNVHDIPNIDIQSVENIDIFIVMFDLTNLESFHNIHKYISNNKTIICGNKCDIKERKITTRDIFKIKNTFFHCPYFDISTKTNYNFDKPFLIAIKKYTNNYNINFIDCESYHYLFEC
jgi:GTP-binding nuclear protein Ran